MNRKSAVSLLGACGLGLGTAATAGVVALSSPAGAAPVTPHVVAATSVYPPVVTTSTPVEGESFSKAPTGAVTASIAPTTNVKGESFTKTAAVSDPGGRDDLPFTGADVAGISVVGIALVGGGGLLLVAGRRRRGAHR